MGKLIDPDYYDGSERSFVTIHFPEKGNGTEIGAPVKTARAAFKRAYKIMKEKRKGHVMVRFETDWGYASISSPYAIVRNSEGRRCICELRLRASKDWEAWGIHPKKKYFLHPDGSLGVN